MLSFIALAMSPTADASAFRTQDIPYSTTMTFSWDVIGASGSTSYSFDSANRWRPTTLCRGTTGCMNGAFSTGNGGEGSFQTQVVVEDQVNDCSGTVVLFGTSPWTCDLTQNLLMTYDGTGAVYDGTADYGSVDFDITFLLGIPIGVSNASYTYAPGNFAGTMSTPGGATGSFTE